MDTMAVGNLRIGEKSDTCYDTDFCVEPPEIGE